MTRHSTASAAGRTTNHDSTPAGAECTANGQPLLLLVDGAGVIRSCAPHTMEQCRCWCIPLPAAGATLFDCVAAHQHTLLRETLNLALRGHVLRRKLTMLHAHGALQRLETEFIPYGTEPDGVSGIAVLIRHEEHPWPTSRREHECAMQQIISQVVHVVHEIRNPLNGIIPLIEMLRSGEFEKDRMQFLDYMEVSAGMIQTLVNDVLDTAKLEAGRIEVRQVVFNPAQLLTEVVKSQMGPLIAKGVAMAADCDQTVPSWLEGDAFHFKQILVNLVGNAVKFTDQGTITVTMNLHDSTPDQVLLKTVVQDTGIGMTGEELQRLFEPFAQADPAAGGRYRGSGLGLSISLKLAHLMGGELWAESVPGQGTAFQLLLPFIRITSGSDPVGSSQPERTYPAR